MFAKLLEIDDKLKFGGTDGDYAEIMDAEGLKLECRNRKLPDSVNEEALRMLIRSNEIEKHAELNNEEIEATSRITDGEEIRVNTGAIRFKRVIDGYTSMKRSELKKLCDNLYGKNNMSNTFIMKNLLEIDDIARVGEFELAYDQMSVKDLRVECKDRNLPLTDTKSALQILLRGRYILVSDATESHATQTKSCTGTPK